MIHPVSKNKMHEWINSYDINNIFKTELNINKLSSDGYWQKWSRITFYRKFMNSDGPKSGHRKFGPIRA